MSYRVLFIEDSPENIGVFYGVNEEYFKSIESSPCHIETIELKEDMEETIKDIIDKKVDVIIFDYYLGESNQNIKYSGSDLLTEVGTILPNFPTFMLTSFGDDAENSKIDVNKVYDKEIYFDNPSKLNERIKKQILNYKESISNAEEELLILLEKSENEKLTIIEEERIIFLDDFLEKSNNSTSSIPTALKKITLDEKLDKLLLESKNILDRLK